MLRRLLLPLLKLRRRSAVAGRRVWAPALAVQLLRVANHRIVLTDGVTLENDEQLAVLDHVADKLLEGDDAVHVHLQHSATGVDAI